MQWELIFEKGDNSKDSFRCGDITYISSLASGVVPIKKPPGLRLAQAFFNMVSACS